MLNAHSLAAQLEAAYQQHNQTIRTDTLTLSEGTRKALFRNIAEKMEGVETWNAAQIAVLVHNIMHYPDIRTTASSGEYAAFIAWMKPFLEVLCGDTALAASTLAQFNRLQGEDTRHL